VEELRKPILSTPTRKRERRDDGAWQSTPGRGETMEGPTSTPRRLRQTPIGNFLVHQSLAVRRRSLQAVTDGQNPDMSASPQLKTRKKAQHGRKGLKGAKKTSTKVVGFVEMMAKNYEKHQPCLNQPTVAAPKTELNNTSSVFRQMQGGIAQAAAHSYPEMALQADGGRGGAQPMAYTLAGQVTRQTGVQPTTAQIELEEQNITKNSHFDRATLARNYLESRE
jgi:hypothetical protein